MSIDKFRKHINDGYTFKGDFIVLGGAILNEEPVSDALIKVPLKSLNRHGLIAGATGTGKTKEIKRALSLFPQVINHGRDEKRNWIIRNRIDNSPLSDPSRGNSQTARQL